MPFDGSEPCVSFIPEVPQLEGCEALGLNGSCPHLADSGNILFMIYVTICTYYLWIYDSMIIYIYCIHCFYAHVFPMAPSCKCNLLVSFSMVWALPRLVMSWLQCCYACDEVPGRCM